MNHHTLINSIAAGWLIGGGLADVFIESSSSATRIYGAVQFGIGIAAFILN